MASSDNNSENGMGRFKNGPVRLDIETITNKVKKYKSGNLTPAILVENGIKRYGNDLILNNFNMSVERGTIYGLLGASGCGKTTILSCIVGLKTLDSGKIHVFGEIPGSKRSGIPGKTVGYMPQDIGLYQVFTIEEILHYFGKIYGMTKGEVETRIKSFMTFLGLPDRTSLISSLSGGQQRRTSLAVSLLHEPKLLILDEPTVGVDPLIRESIWKYLREMVEQNQTTVIITTHYIEEARESDMVGLMRNGRLLTEKPPLTLLREHNAVLLEDIVLKLCKKDNFTVTASETNEIRQALSDVSFYSGKQVFDSDDLQPILGLTFKTRSPDDLTIREPPQTELDRRNRKASTNLNFGEAVTSHFNIIWALLQRNILTLLRYPGYLFTCLLIPTITLVIVNLVVGKDIKNLQLGVVNHEFLTPDYLELCKHNELSCFNDKLSCNFLNSFPQNVIQWVPFSSEQKALGSVQRGYTSGFITIPDNFTLHMKDRSLHRNFATNETLEGTEIGIRLDMSATIRANFIRAELIRYYIEFIKGILADCGGDERSVELPFHFDAVYGSLTQSYLAYILPSQMLLIIFMTPMATALMIITDRKLGTMDRNMVAGAKMAHVFTAFIVSEGMMITAAVVMFYSIITLVFDFRVTGSIFLSFLILFCQGITGLSIGFVFGTFWDHELEVVISILGFFVPNILLSGGTWPLEGLPLWTKLICQSLPVTLSTTALRQIFNKGWGLEHPQVWQGFASLISWCVLAWILCGLINRSRK